MNDNNQSIKIIIVIYIVLSSYKTCTSKTSVSMILQNVSHYYKKLQKWSIWKWKKGEKTLSVKVMYIEYGKIYMNLSLTNIEI